MVFGGRDTVHTFNFGGSLSDAHFERLSPSHVRFGGIITSYVGVFSGSKFLDLSVKDFNATA